MTADTSTTGPALASPIELFGDPKSLAAILWEGRRLILAGVAAGLLLALAYLATATKLYQASAKLLVLEHGVAPLAAVGGDTGAARLIEGAEDTIPTHAIIVSSPVVVGRAIDAVGLNNLPSLGSATSPDAAVLAVTEGLSVSRPDRQAKILQIAYRSRSAREAVLVVRAIAESYQAFLGEVYARDNSEVVVLMSRARDDLNRELKELEQKYLEFRQKTPHLTGDGTGRTFAGQRIDEWNRAAREVTLKAVQLKAQLELGKDLAREGVGLWSIAYAMDQVAGPTAAGGGGLAARVQGAGLSAPSDYIRQLSTEQQKLADSLGPQSTKVKEIQEQIAQVQVHARRSRGQIERGEVDELLGSVTKSLASLEAMRATIQKQFESDLTEAKTAENDRLAETNLKNELERHRTLFNTVVDRLKQARLVGDFSGTRSTVIEPPNAGEKAVWPRASLTLALALIAGGILGLAAALGAELVAPRVRSVAEMRRVLQLPVLGQLPALAKDQTPLAGSIGLICQAMPRSPSAEAYRLVRANLDISRRGREVRVILVTGPHAGEGASTVASNLAVALAEAGRTVALVDGDLRTPSLHLTFGLTGDRGFVHLLRDLLPTTRVAQATRVPNLDLVAAGPEVPNPAELLSSPELPAVVARLGERYDTVVIDAPPLLGFADASILGSVADGVILVVRLGETKRADAVRAVEALKALGTPVLGAVINGANPEAATAWPRVTSNFLGAVSANGNGYGHAGASEPWSAEALTAIPFDPRMNIAPRPTTKDLPGAFHAREPRFVDHDLFFTGTTDLTERGFR